MTALIAEIRVRFLHPDGKEYEGRLAVGIPVQEPDQASCLAVIEGLSPDRALHGDNTLQALIAAEQYIAWELHAFVERGGRVVRLESREDVDLAAVFGQLWAPTPS